MHINYGLFVAYTPLFQNTAVVKLRSPQRAFSNDGAMNYSTRKLMPYVSYEQRMVPMTYIFCAVVLATSGRSTPTHSLSLM